MVGQELVEAVAQEVEKQMRGGESSHDWWHIYRVWQNARSIAEHEDCDRTIVEVSALLHDIADWKHHDGDDMVGPRVAGEILTTLGAPKDIIEQVKKNIYEGSFKGAGIPTVPATIEGKIMQDADRLDALGAIGIARTFAYGGSKGRPMHDPDIKPATYASKEEYAKNTSPTINHFYEKLFLLKDLMNTKTARSIAEDRHAYMEEYVRRFLAEWEGKM